MATLVASLALAARPIPWALDDLNYFNYHNWAEPLLLSQFAVATANPVALLFSEMGFLLFNYVLSWALNPEGYVRLLVFAGAAGCLLALGKLTNYSFLALALYGLLPQAMIQHITHLRQGLGLALYLSGFAVGGRLGAGLRLLSPFIHVAFYVNLLVEAIDRFLRGRVSPYLRYAVIVAGCLGGLQALQAVLLAAGDRRVDEYQFQALADASGVGFIVWGIIGLSTLFLLSDGRFQRMAKYGILVYLATYFYVDFGARVFENFLPFIVASVALSGPDKRYLFAGALAAVGLIGWLVIGVRL